MKTSRGQIPGAKSPRAEIYSVIVRIPRGRVATYGQVAALAGFPRHARLVGHALRSLDEDSGVPWQRVVNAQGRISPRSEESPMARVQRYLLEKEGVVFDAGGRIPLARFQWEPRGDRSLPPDAESPAGRRFSEEGRRRRPSRSRAGRK